MQMCKYMRNAAADQICMVTGLVKLYGLNIHDLRPENEQKMLFRGIKDCFKVDLENYLLQDVLKIGDVNSLECLESFIHQKIFNETLHGNHFHLGFTSTDLNRKYHPIAFMLISHEPQKDFDYF
ncbi:hypothetical protein BpHYR1_021573 [Brachionus plicatilis]|uniref:Uncharacterized protein n=1 Tax=Brachionus plicatilis TaxID=10195 RepID=A0A3M7S6N2_BRAPC|nr:hypothetical protein BpHYR1_021573 [Brachionus plicatilis]